jgi:dTDP-D-glucose 4,6-dehydratase
VIVLDELTYGGKLENLAPVASRSDFVFVVADIVDGNLIREILDCERPGAIIHFAAVSHVDRLIHSPAEFIRTNFCTFRQVRSTALWHRPIQRLRKIRRTLPIIHTLHRRQPATTWRVPTFIQMDCRCLRPTIRTIMAHAISPIS